MTQLLYTITNYTQIMTIVELVSCPGSIVKLVTPLLSLRRISYSAESNSPEFHYAE